MIQRSLLSLLGAALLALALAGCGQERTAVRTVTRTVTAPSPEQSLDQRTLVSDQHLFGTIASMAPASEGRYLLRLNASFLVTGLTANTAQAEAQGRDCRPERCPPVDDDSYTTPSKATLVFFVPKTAHVQVLVNRGAEGIEEQPISVLELAALVHGRHPVKLFEPLASGVWLVVKGDTVQALSQQYRP